MLFLTSPMMRGAEVEQLQRQLRAHGVDPGPVDGVFGPATEHAVVRFQRLHHLEADGVVGPRTRAALVGLQPPAHRPPPHDAGARSAAIGEGAVRWMIERLGMGEDPPGSNRNPITAEFGMVGPWCAMTVSLAFKHGEHLVLGAETARHHSVWGYWPDRGFASVDALEAWGKLAGYWIGKAHPIVGDIVIYQEHTGMVRAPIADGSDTFGAVEGNEGNQVTKTERRLADPYVQGFIRVRKGER